jgi:peptidoglycan/LPS O-acetylase OafA/YrhL
VAEDGTFLRTIGLLGTQLDGAPSCWPPSTRTRLIFGTSRRWVSALFALLAWIGVYSYAIYLSQVTALGILERDVGRRILAWAGRATATGWTVAVLAVCTGVIVVGMIAGRVVEWPCVFATASFHPNRVRWRLPIRVGGRRRSDGKDGHDFGRRSGC